MPQIDDSTLAFLCFLGFLIAAPLTICGVFAISEFLHQRRKTTGKHLQCLQRAVRRCQFAPVAERAGRRADERRLRSESSASEADSAF